MPYRTSDFPRACEAGLRDKLAAIAAWSRFAEHITQQSADTAQTREGRMDRDRRLAALERTRSAIEAHSLTLAGDERVQGVSPCALIVHRSNWIRDALAEHLEQRGVTTVAEADDGAEGLGVTIVEQPDVLFLEDRLPSVPALELVREVRAFSPNTLVTAQVEHLDDVADLLEAGAAAVFSRRVTLAEVAEHVEALLKHPREEPLVVP